MKECQESSHLIVLVLLLPARLSFQGASVITAEVTFPQSLALPRSFLFEKYSTGSRNLLLAVPLYYPMVVMKNLAPVARCEDPKPELLMAHRRHRSQRIDCRRRDWKGPSTS